MHEATGECLSGAQVLVRHILTGHTSTNYLDLAGYAQFSILPGMCEVHVTHPAGSSEATMNITAHLRS